MQVTVEKTSPDGLTVETWRFCVIGMDLILDDYTKATRPTRRHKGMVTAHYNRLGFTDRRTQLSEADVPWSDALAGEAKQKLVDEIRVGRWRRDFGH